MGADAEQRGRPRGARYPVGIRISAALLARVERIGRANGMNRAEVIRAAVADYCNRMEQEGRKG